MVEAAMQMSGGAALDWVDMVMSRLHQAEEALEKAAREQRSQPRLAVVWRVRPEHHRRATEVRSNERLDAEVYLDESAARARREQLEASLDPPPRDRPPVVGVKVKACIAAVAADGKTVSLLTANQYPVFEMRADGTPAALAERFFPISDMDRFTENIRQVLPDSWCIMLGCRCLSEACIDFRRRPTQGRCAGDLDPGVRPAVANSMCCESMQGTVWDGDNDVVIIIGCRASGKTTMLLDLLAHRPDVTTGVACSSTESDLRQVFGDERFHTRLNFEAIQQLLVLQQDKLAAKDMSPAVLVLDHCILELGHRNMLADVVPVCIKNRISVLLAVTYSLAIPKAVEEVATRTLMFARDAVEKRKVRRQLIDVIDDAEYDAVHAEAAGSRYGALVIRHDGKRWVVTTYTASPPPDAALEQSIREPAGVHLSALVGLSALREQLTAIKGICDMCMAALPVC